MDYDYYTTGYETATNASNTLGGSNLLSSIISLAIAVFFIVCIVKILKKAGKKGWECFIPIYNIIVMLQIAGLPTWYIVLYLVPFANIYVAIKMNIELAHKFGKSTGFGVGLILLPIIFMPILALSKDCQYSDGFSFNETSNNFNNNMMNNINTNNTPVNNVVLEPTQPIVNTPVEPQPVSTPVNNVNLEPAQPIVNTPVEPQPVSTPVNNVILEPTQPVVNTPVAPQPISEPVLENNEINLMNRQQSEIKSVTEQMNNNQNNNIQ